MEQIGVHKGHGGLQFRKGKLGVVARLHDTRVAVCFDGEPKPVRLKPYLLRVIEQWESSGVNTGGVTSADDKFGSFHWHGYISHADTLADPTPEQREARLALRPDSLLLAPVSLAEWIHGVTFDQGEHFQLWHPVPGQWKVYDHPGLDVMREQYILLAAQMQSIYVAVRTWGKAWVEVSAEAVDVHTCAQAREHLNPAGGRQA